MNSTLPYLLYGLMTALAPTLAVLASWKLTKGKLAEIHILVNSRLQEALQEIEELKDQIQHIPAKGP